MVEVVLLPARRQRLVFANPRRFHGTVTRSVCNRETYRTKLDHDPWVHGHR